MNYIQEYVDKIRSGEIIVSEKVKILYYKLENDMKDPKQIKIYDEINDEYEMHTYIFDEEKIFRKT